MTVAILGAGKMGEALLSGLLRSGYPAGSVIAATRRSERAAELSARYGVPGMDAAAAAKQADTLVLTVKPQDMSRLLDEIAPAVPPQTLLISVAAGITTSFISARLRTDVPVVRVMSNTPVLVDEAMSVISAGEHAGEAHLRRAEELLRPVGKVARIPESLQDAATALSGSGPAYVYFLVESMVDAGILLGMSRSAALEMVIQAVYGAATMLRESGEHPVILREAVTSPAGTTISAIRELERHGVRAAFLAAIEAARDRGRELGAGLSVSLTLFWDSRMAEYDFGPDHPLAPVRVVLTVELAAALGVLSAVPVVAPAAATDDELRLVHDEAYIAAVRQAGTDGRPNGWYGLGTPDNPVFPGMHDAAALIAGGTLAAARAVWDGSASHGANVAGGLHHAMRRSASGFCVYNDPAIAIAALLAAGASRVGYVDLDVHHGDGVQAAFYADPRVLTISLHEHPSTLFPGTGLASETGTGDGRGYAVNVALPAGTGDDGWLRALDAIVPPLLGAFAPEVLVTQHGCDTHLLDPLAHLAVSLDAQRLAAAMMHDLAHSCAGGRWVLCGGGGYQRVRVVPRCWTHLLGIAAGAPVAPRTATPESWRVLAKELSGEEAPDVMTDGMAATFLRTSDSGIDPADPVDRAIMNTQQAVFPWHGLFPAVLFPVKPAGQTSCVDPLRSVWRTRVQRLRPNSNNNEAIGGLALFCTGLTLGTYVTGAQDPVKCLASCGEAIYGRRNPPKRRKVSHRR